MAETVNLKKSYSSLNEKLAKLFDESGVRRSFTIPYVEGQAMADHVNAVGAAANQTGGLTQTVVTSMHHSDGKGWGSGDGHSIGHPADKLRSTLVPKNDERAKEVIGAAQKHIENLKFLLGDKDPDVLAAQNQLNLLKPTNAAGMTLFDVGALVIGIMHKPTQAVARAHSGTKEGGHAAHLRQPEGGAAQPEGQESPQEAQGEASGEGQAPTDQSAASEAPAPAAGTAAPPAGAPVAPQAQG